MKTPLPKENCARPHSLQLRGRPIFELCNWISSWKQQNSRNRFSLFIKGPAAQFEVKKNDGRQSRDTDLPLILRAYRLSAVYLAQVEKNSKFLWNKLCAAWHSVHSFSQSHAKFSWLDLDRGGWFCYFFACRGMLLLLLLLLLLLPDPDLTVSCDGSQEQSTLLNIPTEYSVMFTCRDKSKVIYCINEFHKCK